MAEIEALDGLRVGRVRFRLTELKARSYAEQKHFKLFLEDGDRLCDRPVFHGLVSEGRAAQHVAGWIDGFYGGVALLAGEPVPLARLACERPLFEAIGAALGPGGWLGLAYETLGADTPLLRETRRLLDLGVPPVATPLGELLHAAGCGLRIRNWYISEGWREGPRRLQGFRPSTPESRRASAQETAVELRRFLDRAEGSEGLAPAVERAGRILGAL